MPGNYTAAGLIADAVLVALLLLSITWGKKRGLVYMALWVLAIGAAIFGSRFLADKLTEPISEKVEGSVEEVMLKAAEKFAQKSGSLDLSQFDFSEKREKILSNEELQKLMQSEGFAKLSEQFKKWNMSEDMLKESGYSLAESLHENTEEQNTPSVTNTWVSQTAAALVRKAVRVFIITVGFILILLLLRVLAKWISRGIHVIPLIGSVDRLLGIAFGLAACALLVLLVLFVWPHVHADSFGKIQEGSYLFAFVAEWNPLVGLMT